MGSIEKRARDRWKARYWAPDGKQRSKTFPTEREAKDFLAQLSVDVRRGDWTDPRLARVTVKEWGDLWMDRKAVRLKPTTMQSYRSLYRQHVLPHWGRVRLGDVTHGEVDAWVARMCRTVGAPTVRKAYNVLSQILDAAVKDGRLSKNPAHGVELPRVNRREHTYLSHQQVWTLANAAGDYRPLVLVLAYCGLRFGEAAALRVRNLDLLRRQVRVAQSVTEVDGRLVWGTPKTHKARTVTMPAAVRDVLAEHIAGKGPDDLLFTAPDGGVLRNVNFRRRAWDKAVAKSKVPPLTPHDLRHTAASLAVATGTDVKVVQNMLGHASAAMTLDVYADLFDQSGDALADRLDEAIQRALVSPASPTESSTVVQFPAADG